VLAAVELWQFFLRTLHRNPETSFWSQFRRISATVRSRRIWQTITLSGPLLLSGCASIVKTYVSRFLSPIHTAALILVSRNSSPSVTGMTSPITS
jgi:hypothetical protein